MQISTTSHQTDGLKPSGEGSHLNEETVVSLIATLEELGYLLVREVDPSAGQALLMAAAALLKTAPASSLETF